MVVAPAVRAVLFTAVRAMVVPFALVTMRMAGLGVVLPLCQARRHAVHMARRRAVRMRMFVLRRVGVLRMLGVLLLLRFLRFL